MADPSTMQLLMQYGPGMLESVMPWLDNLFGGSGKKPENPFATWLNTFLRDQASADETQRRSNINQFGPWGRITYQGEPGTSSYRQVWELNPQDQQILDAQRAAALGLTDLFNVYYQPQLQRLGQNPFNLSGLPGLDIEGRGSVPTTSASPSQTGSGGLPSSYLPPGFTSQSPDPNIAAWEAANEKFRTDTEAWQAAEDERETVLPTHISRGAVMDFYNTFGGSDKFNDIDRFFRNHGITPNAEGLYSVEDLRRFAPQGFSGASNRSRGILAQLPSWLTNYLSEQGELAPNPLGEKPIAPRRADYF